MLTNLAECRRYINVTVKHVKSRVGSFFGPQGHNLNKFGRGSLEGAAYIHVISRL